MMCVYTMQIKNDFFEYFQRSWSIWANWLTGLLGNWSIARRLQWKIYAHL